MTPIVTILFQKDQNLRLEDLPEKRKYKSKKVDCKARIIVKKVIKFPKFKVRKFCITLY